MKKLMNLLMLAIAFVIIATLFSLSVCYARSNDSYFTSDKNDWSLENGKWWVTMDPTSKIFSIRCLISGMNLGSAAACQQIAVENPILSGLDKVHEKALRSLMPECDVEKIVSYIDKVYEDNYSRIIPIVDIIVVMAKEQETKFDETKRAEVFRDLVSKYEKVQNTLKQTE